MSSVPSASQSSGDSVVGEEENDIAEKVVNAHVSDLIQKQDGC